MEITINSLYSKLRGALHDSPSGVTATPGRAVLALDTLYLAVNEAHTEALEAAVSRRDQEWEKWAQAMAEWIGDGSKWSEGPLSPTQLEIPF